MTINFRYDTLKKFLDTLPSHKKYKDLELIVAKDPMDPENMTEAEIKIFQEGMKEYLGDSLKKYENIVAMDGGEIIDNINSRKIEYSRIKKIKAYIKSKF